MASPRLRHSVRALLLSPDDRLLLCRFDAGPTGRIWATPGGGIETGESPMEALRRELMEEAGFVLDRDPPHVWRREVVDPTHLAGYDGVLMDFYLVRCGGFDPRGSFTDEELAAEGIAEFRWWTTEEILGAGPRDLFVPRALGQNLRVLLDDGPSTTVLLLGL